MSWIRVALLALLASAALVRPASAHALGAECKLRNGRIELEAYFDDDTAARDAKVRVLDERENMVAEGRTDERGRWSFSPPAPGRYQVCIDAGAGHATQLRITVPAAAAPAENFISDGPSRSEFTRIPWPRVGLGLGFLAVVALAGSIFARLRARAARTSSPLSPTDPTSIEEHHHDETPRFHAN